MKKRMLLSLVLIPILLGGVGLSAFASGQSEDDTQPGRPGPWGGRGWDQRPAPTFSEETVTVTGQVYFDNRMHPELKSGAKEYELLVPRYYLYEVDLEDGDTVTVEGYTVTGMPMFEEEDGDEVHLWVAKAVIDGKEYDLERYGYGRGPGRGGRMGMGRAPYGYGPPCGPGGYGPDWGRRPWGPGGPGRGPQS